MLTVQQPSCPRWEPYPHPGTHAGVVLFLYSMAGDEPCTVGPPQSTDNVAVPLMSFACPQPQQDLQAAIPLSLQQLEAQMLGGPGQWEWPHLEKGVM